MPLLFTLKRGPISALNFMRKLFAISCVRSSVVGIFLLTLDLFAEDAVFTGKLIRKYYQHLIPQAVELGVFGWFLELDSSSKVNLQKKLLH